MYSNIETKAIIERLKLQLTEFYDGSNWVTDSFSKRVLSKKPQHALMQIQGFNHSVAALVGHIAAWRNFAYQKLSGNDKYDIIERSSVNWPDEIDWNVMVEQFGSCHHDLIKAIDEFPVERWNTTVPGRNYSFVYLVNGVVHHDYYHYGQIGSMLAAIEKAEAAI